MASSGNSFSRMVCLFLTGVMALALFGCAAMSRTEGTSRMGVALRPGGNALSALVDYAARLSGLSAAELERERNAARQLHVRDKSDFRALQYVLALRLPGGDLRRAQQLLEPMLAEPARHASDLRALAQLLATDLGERRRLEGNVQAQARRADELEAKLNALKEVETNMQQQARPGVGQ